MLIQIYVVICHQQAAMTYTQILEYYVGDLRMLSELHLTPSIPITASSQPVPPGEVVTYAILFQTVLDAP